MNARVIGGNCDLPSTGKHKYTTVEWIAEQRMCCSFDVGVNSREEGVMRVFSLMYMREGKTGSESKREYTVAGVSSGFERSGDGFGFLITNLY